MPHLVILYTPNIEPETDLSTLCRSLADTMLAHRDEAGKAVFPPGGTRVLAFPAAHHAVSDGGTAGRAAGGSGDYAFVYLNLRMGSGRPPAVVQAVGDTLLGVVKQHFEPLLAQRHIGITLQVDEGAPSFDGKYSNLHPLFNKAV